MANNNLPETYGPKCGGKTPQEDSFNCQQQANQQQSSMNKAGGSSCKVIAPQAKGGVEVNSPQNNAQNAGQLHGALNQANSYSKYDNSVGSRNVDNSAGAGGGRKRKRKTKKRKSQKLRRRKVFVGCNRKSRKRLGGKTKKTSSWGCMSGGKRKTKKRVTKKGGSFLSTITNRLSGKKDDNNNEERTAIIKRPEQFTKEEENYLNTKMNTGDKQRENYYGPTDDHSDERPATIKRPSKLTPEEEAKFKLVKSKKNVRFDESKNKRYGGKRKTKKRKTKKGGDFLSRLNPFENKKEKEEKLAKQKAKEQAEKFAFEAREEERQIQRKDFLKKQKEEREKAKRPTYEGGKRKTRKFKKHFMFNTKGKRYVAKTRKQHLRGKKLGHTHTKPKRKTRKTKKRKTRKTRKARRRGGMTDAAHAKEYALRRDALRKKRSGESNLSVLEDARKREEKQQEARMTMMKTMAGMEAEAAAKNKTRQSLPNMSTTLNNLPDVRSRSNTSNF